MSKPKYMKGGCIRSLDDLVLQENIYWNGRIWNRKWFMNLQIQTLLSLIEHKALKHAVRRDGSTDDVQPGQAGICGGSRADHAGQADAGEG